ncbi:MAG TPA: efflux RND transporter periplasmic adaptor subunit [Roseiflexaceae bacterium]|nr:efflux RND transporter periplasmic adaptor subunit [Roseiflexaceae bacterium]
MATIATSPERKRSGRRRWVIAAVVVLVLITVAACLLLRGASQAVGQQQTGGWQTVAASSGAINASVSATGNVEPQAQADLRFDSGGTVSNIYVKPGQQVISGTELARIDDTALQLALERAKTDLRQAETDRDKLNEGPTEQDLTSARARLAQAEAQARQVNGSVTRADVEAARARLEAARARLNAVQSGFTDLRSTENDVQKAQTQFDSRRDELSLAKTNAKLALDQSVNDLTRAQASYATAKQNWDFVQETNQDPSNPEVVVGDKRVANKLSDTQRQQYYDTFIQAETALRSAESNVEKAQINYDQTRQAEVTGVQSAEQDLAAARTRLDEQRAGGNASQVAQARADVQSAQADLNRLTGADRSGNLASAQASVEIARADLEKLSVGPTESERVTAQTAVERANIAVKQAEYDLTNAVLKAPFAGTVARVDLRVGEPASGTIGSGTDQRSAGITLVDLNGFSLKVPIDELDVAQIRPGQQVLITLDALPDQELKGEVASVEPLATRSSQGTNTYQVTITFNSEGATILAGMTAAVEIVTLQKQDVVLVPRRAVIAESGKNYVRIPKEGPPDPATGAPAFDRREVTLGLSNADQVEIVSGLKAGEQVLVQDVVSTFNPLGPTN